MDARDLIVLAAAARAAKHEDTMKQISTFVAYCRERIPGFSPAACDPVWKQSIDDLIDAFRALGGHDSARCPF